MTTPTTGAPWKSPALRACVAYEATQKPEVECEERKEHESPPVALHTEEDGDEEDPRREKGAHDDRLSGVLTRPWVDPPSALFVCSHFATTILRRTANGSSGSGSGGRLPLAGVPPGEDGRITLEREGKSNRGEMTDRRCRRRLYSSTETELAR